MSTASEIGVRESRMITGGHILSEEEVLDCTKFEDGIAACNYDIDIHNPEGTGTSHHYFAHGEYYTIPYRCLCPTKVGNLLVAGRCISSTHEAQASYQIMPTVCTIGQAAGVGAAVAYKQGYDYYVKEAFKGVADVRYPSTNCMFTTVILRCLSDWAENLEYKADVDLIHWNAGLWDDLIMLDYRHLLPPGNLQGKCLSDMCHNRKTFSKC